jgi:hypothetical protein
VRRPRLDYESHATALDRNELGAILVAAGLGPPAEHALVSLPALNGLRVPEATGADIVSRGASGAPTDLCQCLLEPGRDNTPDWPAASSALKSWQVTPQG